MQHFHEYDTWTLYVDGHRHVICGKTSMAIPMLGGGHTHYFEGYTSGYPDHRHWYSGNTTVVFG